MLQKEDLGPVPVLKMVVAGSRKNLLLSISMDMDALERIGRSEVVSKIRLGAVGI